MLSTRLFCKGRVAAVYKLFKNGVLHSLVSSTKVTLYGGPSPAILNALSYYAAISLACTALLAVTAILTAVHMNAQGVILFDAALEDSSRVKQLPRILEAANYGIHGVMAIPYLVSFCQTRQAYGYFRHVHIFLSVFIAIAAGFRAHALNSTANLAAATGLSAIFWSVGRICSDGAVSVAVAQLVQLSQAHGQILVAEQDASGEQKSSTRRLSMSTKQGSCSTLSERSVLPCPAGTNRMLQQLQRYGKCGRSLCFCVLSTCWRILTDAAYQVQKQSERRSNRVRFTRDTNSDQY